jgi:putative transposase
MARQPRRDIAGIAQHIVQRGNDRQACLGRESDYANYLRELREAARKHDCAIHACVLTTNHVHLLDELRAYTQQQRAYGSERFRKQIQALTQRTATIRPRGRSKKPPDHLEK